MEEQNQVPEQQTPEIIQEAQVSQQTPVNNQMFPSVFSLYKQSYAALRLSFIPMLKLGLLPLVALLPLLLVIALQVMTSTNSGSSSSHMVANIVSFVIGTLSVIALIILAIKVSPAITYVQIEAVRGNKVGARQALDHTKEMVANYFIMSLLVGLLIIGGFILLIIPGLFMWKRYVIAGYNLVDGNLSWSEAMSKSTELAKKYSGAHWSLVGLSVVTSAVGYIPYIGWAISLVMTVMYYLAPTVRFEEVKAAG